MNTSLYNRERYNVGSPGEQIRLFTHFADSIMHSVAGVKVYEDFAFAVSAVIKGGVELKVKISYEHRSAAIVNNKTTLRVLVFVTHESDNNFKSVVHVGKILHYTANNLSAVNARVYVGKYMHFSLEAENEINADVYAGKNMFFVPDFEAFMNCDVSMGTTRYVIAIINTTIPPGGEIRIDSGVFTALLEQESILHAYKGDWITFFRDTKQLILDNATGGDMTGEVIYNARYL